jgi:hypothetical protein
MGGVPDQQKMATIELYGLEVLPRVTEILADPDFGLDSPTVSWETQRSELPVSLDEGAERHLRIISPGKIGTAIARAAVAGGYDVAISGSGTADRLELIHEVLALGAHAVTTDEVIPRSDLINSRSADAQLPDPFS